MKCYIPEYDIVAGVEICIFRVAPLALLWNCPIRIIYSAAPLCARSASTLCAMILRCTHNHHIDTEVEYLSESAKMRGYLKGGDDSRGRSRLLKIAGVKGWRKGL